MSAPTLAGRRVLVVEDRFLIAEELCAEIAKLGGEVVGPVRTVPDALRLVEGGGLDLALLDINLDGELVYPVAEMLTEKQTPIIFLTGYDEGIVDARWRDAPRLPKPVSFKALSEEVAKLL